ncbi:MAG: hypothetical protein SFY66_05165 [Oculatellaceae cyanobacterium bins.114]|nr:hypothetical protein [Oculatellaceae cyanobacterium bins.114]
MDAVVVLKAVVLKAAALKAVALKAFVGRFKLQYQKIAAKIVQMIY